MIARSDYPQASPTFTVNLMRRLTYWTLGIAFFVGYLLLQLHGVFGRLNGPQQCAGRAGS